MISQAQLHKFIELYQKHYGIVLGDEAAQVKAGRLVGLVKAIYKPIKKLEIINNK